MQDKYGGRAPEKNALAWGGGNTEPVMLSDQLHATAFFTQRNVLYQTEWGLGGPNSIPILQKKKNPTYQIHKSRFPGPKSQFIIRYNLKTVTASTEACDS
jgi:hypothetical protein